MATVKPRLQILLKPDTKLAIERAAEQMGVSASRLVCEFLDEALPAICMVGDAFEEAKRNQADSSLNALNTLKDSLLKARQNASDAQVDIEDLISTEKVKSRSGPQSGS